MEAKWAKWSGRDASIVMLCTPQTQAARPPKPPGSSTLAQTPIDGFYA